MTPIDRTQARMSAAVLESCGVLCWPTPVFLLATFFWAAALQATGLWVVLPVCWVCAASQFFFAWRLRLDARLLRALQAEEDLAQLDLVLHRLFGRAANTPCRSMAQRQQGIRRLLRWFLLASAGVWVSGIFACSLHAFGRIAS